jgi:hypothetical protein
MRILPALSLLVLVIPLMSQARASGAPEATNKIKKSTSAAGSGEQVRNPQVKKPTIPVPYEGQLQASLTYRADARSDGHRGLVLLPPLRMLEHYAVRIEWTNLREFPALRRSRRQSRVRQILFTVVSDEIRQMTEWRWNRTLRCKIIRVD